MKKLKSMLVTLAMLLCCISVGAHDFEVDGIYYKFISSEDKTVEVTHKTIIFTNYYGVYSGEISIPETVEYNHKCPVKTR